VVQHEQAMIPWKATANTDPSPESFQEGIFAFVPGGLTF